MKTTHFVLLSSTIALGIVLQGCGRGSALKVSADRTAKLTGIKQVVQANAAADQAKVVYEIKTQKNVEDSFINGVLTLADRGLPIPAFRPTYDANSPCAKAPQWVMTTDVAQSRANKVASDLVNKAAEACGPTIAAAVATVRLQGIAVMQWDNVTNPNLDIAKVSGNAQFTLARERAPNSGHWEDLGFRGVADCEMLNDPDVKIWACATRVAPDRSFRENL